eukprot:1345776-Pyramimonas_sp.AAC.1
MSSHLPLFGTCTAHVRRRPWRAVSCVPTIALVGIMSNAGASTLQGRPESEILSCTGSWGVRGKLIPMTILDSSEIIHKHVKGWFYNYPKSKMAMPKAELLVEDDE